MSKPASVGVKRGKISLFYVAFCNPRIAPQGEAPSAMFKLLANTLQAVGENLENMNEEDDVITPRLSTVSLADYEHQAKYPRYRI